VEDAVAKDVKDNDKDSDKKVDLDALSAAIAGFLACHVLTCRYLVQEGVIDRERFLAYLEDALSEMSPEIEDKRSLFGLHQLIESLRAKPAPGVQ
jgi:hypothetical protein